MKNTFLQSASGNCLGLVRNKEIEIARNYKGLTVISGTSGSGKNTMLAGIALRTPTEDNLLILTESYIGDFGYNIADDFVEVPRLSFDDFLKLIEEAEQPNIFIEQWLHFSWGTTDQEQCSNMKKLSDLAFNLNKNIVVCIHRKRSNGL